MRRSVEWTLDNGRFIATEVVLNDLAAGVCTTPCQSASTASRLRSPASETLSRGFRGLSFSNQICHFMTVNPRVLPTTPPVLAVPPADRARLVWTH